MKYNNYELIKDKDDDGVYILVSNNLIEDGAIERFDSNAACVILNEKYTLDLFHMPEATRIRPNNYKSNFITPCITALSAILSINRAGTSIEFLYSVYKTKRLLVVLAYKTNRKPGVIYIGDTNKIGLSVSIATETEDIFKLVDINNNIYIMENDGNVTDPVTGKLVYENYEGEYEQV